MKEKHIQCGDWNFFTDSMQKSGVERHAPPQNPVAEIYGLKIVENKLIPKDRALLVGADGKIIQIYDL